MKSLHRTSTAQESLNSSAVNSSAVNRRTLLGAALGGWRYRTIGGLWLAGWFAGSGGLLFIFCSERFCF